MLSHAVLLSLLAAAAHATEHLVQVGGLNLTFTPQNISAEVGDSVTFVYHPKNHTATQSSFDQPCSPRQDGFDSGFMFVQSDMQDALPTFTITINDTQPVWVHCRQMGHCSQGMVFSANAPLAGPNTFDKFQAAALATGGSTSSDNSSTSSDASIPPSPVVETVTATVTLANSVYTTTYASWSGAAADPTPAAQPAVHTVIVGGNAGNVYTPPVVNASLGDTVSFLFQAKNHSVTQSTFDTPCTKMMAGFDSGFMPVPPNATSSPTFNITVNTTTPTWIYCRQTGTPTHCQQGMVLAINPPSTGPDTFEAFRQLAMHSNTTSISGSGSSGSGTNSSSGSGSGSGSGSSSSGAGRAAVSVGLGMGITAFAVAALL